MTKPTVDKVVAAYIRVRDAKELVQARHAEELKPFNEHLTKLEGWLQSALLVAGVESFKTAEGTAFLQENDTATVRDHAALLDWIIANREWSMLTTAVSKLAVRDYLEKTGNLPPGVDYKKAQVTRVRRPKTVKSGDVNDE